MLKIKNGFVLREVSENYVVIAVGSASKDFKGIINLNETGAFLWKKLTIGCTKEELIEAMITEYDAPQDIIKKDVDEFLNIVSKGGLLE